MPEKQGRPLGITILGMVHLVLGSLATLALLADLVMGIAGGIPLESLVWITLAAVLGPGGGNAMLKGQRWAWYLASFGYLAVAFAGWLAAPVLLSRIPQLHLSSGVLQTIAGILSGVAALVAIYLFTGRVADHFGLERRARWVSLAVQLVFAGGLLFGAKSLMELGPPTDDLSVELQQMGERRASAPEDIELMLDRLEDGSVEERVSAAWALGRSGRGDVMPQLLETAREDSDVNVRINAIDAAAALGGAEIQADLVGFLDSDEPELRTAALRGLADEKFAGALQDVGRVMLDSDELRAAAVDVLGNLGTPEAVPLLQQVAGDSQEDVRTRVAYALGKLGDARAVPTLVELLGDQRWPVRANAAQALGMIGDASARPALEGMASDANEQVKGAAAAALSKLP